MSESVYFLALLPTQKIQAEVTQLKVLIAERFNSKHALKSPPHITLHMPFKWKDSKIAQLQTALKKINKDVVPFSVELNGFNFFEPRVIYVDVMKNRELTELQARVVDVSRKDLKLDNGNYKDRPFEPHLTIGFRDLRKPQFYEAKKYFLKREFSCVFSVKKVHLLSYDKKKKSWAIVNLL